MKKFFLTILSGMLFATSYSQEIASEEVLNDGNRRIISTPIDVTNTIKIQLMTIVNDANHSHLKVIVATSETQGGYLFVFPPKGKLLFRLKNDEVIELESVTASDTTYVVKRDMRLGNALGALLNNVLPDSEKASPSPDFVNVTIYRTISLFPVSDEQIDKLCDGIKKIRFETTTDPIDSKKNIAKKIGNAHDALLERITYGAGQLETKKSIHEGF